jgi:Holliday junction resolvase RusA-like endonuclease
VPVEGPVNFIIEYREASRRRDPDNFAAAKKFILDGLVQAGVLADDGWDEVVGFDESWIVDKEKPGVLVTIVET